MCVTISILYFFLIADYEYYQDLTLLYFVVVFIHYAWVFLYNKGRTVGMMICGVAYASMYSGELLTRAEYHQLMFARIATDLKYNDYYETYKFLTSSTFQTISMKKLGIFYIRKRKFDQLYKK